MSTGGGPNLVQTMKSYTQETVCPSSPRCPRHRYFRRCGMGWWLCQVQRSDRSFRRRNHI